MYTANTMACAAEALGMTVPGSSSYPAESKEKLDECETIGPVMYNLLEKNILPRDIMTRAAFENAMVPSHSFSSFWALTRFRRF
jgi:dihydroxy-acid dehydratase